jgi:PAS domain S-box-containing protein
MRIAWSRRWKISSEDVFRRWTSAAAPLALLVCAAIWALHWQQKQVIAQTQLAVRQIRQARIDLANGFVHFMLAGEQDSPFDRGQGEALLTQAIAVLERSATREAGNGTRAAVAVPATGNALRRELAEWRRATPAERDRLEVRMRVTYHELEQSADEIDRATRRELTDLADRIDRQFALTLGGAVALLGGVFVGAFTAGRYHKASLRALREGERQLREERDRLSRIAASSPGALHSLRRHPDGRLTFTYVSPRVRDIFGVSPEELGRDAGNAIATWHEDDRPRVLDALRASELSLEPWQAEFRVSHPEKGEIWVEVNSAPAREADGGTSWHGVWTDVTERKRAESRARLQNEVTRVLAEGLPMETSTQRIVEGVCRLLEWEFGAWWELDRATNTMRCSAEWHRTPDTLTEFAEFTKGLSLPPGTGLPGALWEAHQPRWFAELPPEAVCVRRPLAAAVGLREAMGFPVIQRGQVCGVFEFFSRRSRAPDADLLALLGSLGVQIGQSVERAQLEHQVRQAQKMEAIGTLAGGIAHDFNNILAGIVGYTSLAQMSADPQNEEQLGYLAQVVRSSGRAADLVRQILAFSRRQEQRHSMVRLQDVIAESVQLLRATIPTTIEIVAEIPQNLPPVLADATQVHQVLMNLGANAWHAMRDRPGRLELSARVAAPCDGASPAAPVVKTRDCVRVSVRDSGHGMDERTKARIFEPFFTTKGPGEGTGLGLAVVHGIMQSHGGAVEVQSQAGAGTVFHIYFPVAPVEEVEVETPLAAPDEGRGERILLVDDEESIVIATEALLERFGYRVESCTSSRVALERFNEDPARFDLLITDHTLPEFTGLDLAMAIRRLRPTMPILLTTGLLPDETADATGGGIINDVLRKPATPRETLTRIRQLLDRADAGGA